MRAITNIAMTVKLLAFAQAAEQLGFRERDVECSPEETLEAILSRAASTLDRGAMRVAVDCEYRDWKSIVGEAREIALIPPVSGG